jgi:hypothetical protein
LKGASAARERRRETAPEAYDKFGKRIDGYTHIFDSLAA